MGIKGLFYFILFSMVTACSTQATTFSSSTNSDSSEGGTAESLEGGAITEVTIDSNNEATLEFGTVSSSAEYILALYHYDQAGETKAFELSVNAELDESEVINSTNDMVTADITEDVHDQLRQSESELDPDYLITPISVKALGSGGSSTPALESTRSFKVINSFSNTSSYTTQTGVLKYVGDHILFYVSQENVDDFDKEKMISLLDEFDAKVPAEEELFGSWSDIDNNGRVMIFATSHLNGYSKTSGGIVTGYFYAVDLFSASKYAQSNEGEVFYTIVPDPEGRYGTTISESFYYSNIERSVLPHEYQHGINFNRHVNDNGGSPEVSPVNEGMSHLAEGLYSQDESGYMTGVGNENHARVAGYLSRMNELCITCGASLYQRGGIFLFFRYYYEQAEQGNNPVVSSGAELINRLVDTDLTGVENIVEAITGEDYSDEAFARLFGQFSVAVFMSNTGLSTDTRFNFFGVNLRTGNANDNRNTKMTGPATTTYTEEGVTSTIAGTSVSYIKITGDEINKAGGILQLDLAEDTHFGAYLIQTGL